MAVNPFDLDNDLSTFSASEVAAMTEIFNRVAEAYSPFNLNVTTVDPGNRTERVTMRIVVGNSPGWTIAGYTETGGFYNSSSSNTGYVFPGNLGNNTKYVAVATSHEAGHGFGLSHHSSYSGTSMTAEYDLGTAAVAPIMGNAYYSTRGLWTSGPTSAGPATSQADLTVLSSLINAFGYRTDDVGDSTAAATPLTASGGSLSAAGVITKTADVDYFKFTTTGGSVSFTVNPAQYGGMLDAKLELRDASGNLVASANTASLSETLSANVSAGTYYIVVGSAGNYGDIGQYTLTGTLPSGTPTLTVDAGTGYVAAEGGTVSLAASVLSGSVGSYAWDLDGDGVYGETGASATRGNETGATVTFNAIGLDGPSTFSVGLRATGTDGTTIATDTASVAITNAAPTLTTNLDPVPPPAAPAATPAYEGSPITFTFAASDPGNDTITSWVINWGDGTTSTFGGNATSATKTYADNGTYTITFTATDEDGSYSTSRSIAVANVAPTLSLSAPATVNEGSGASITFSATDPGNDSVSSWIVNWGDGTSTTYAANATGGSKTYADNGVYTITLTAIDEDGSYTTTKTITVLNVAPTLTLGGSSTVNEGSALTLTLGKSDPGTDTITGWTINWGDGTSNNYVASATSASKTWADNGTYVVTLTATDEDGSYSITKTITVLNVAPTLTLTSPTSANEGSAVSVSWSKSDPGADTITGWTIDWGNGTTATSFGAAISSASKTYADNGTYTITLTAADEDGTYSVTKTITINNVAPTLTFTVPASALEGSSFNVSFSDSDVGNDTISSWVINWGDGSSTSLAGSATGALKAYADNGTYTITLTATDEDGTYSTTKSITINKVNPTFTVNIPSTVYEGTQASFGFSAADPGNDDISTWTLNWGDGTTTTLGGSASSANKTYADNGTYTLTLTATDEDGTYIVTRTVTVVNVPPAISISNLATLSEGSSFTLNWSVSDPGADTISAWLVTWGDGTTTTLAGSARSVTKTFADNGSYAISVRATDEDGNATATTTATVQNVAPVITWAPATTVAQGDSFAFTWTLSDPGADTVSDWTINWGDGTTSSLAGNIRSASRVYSTAGTRTVTLTATDEDGTYSKVATLQVTVAAPIITLTPSATTIDEGDTLTLGFVSPNRGSTLDGWRIEWGDGTISTFDGSVNSATHTFGDDAVFSVKVTAIDADATETSKSFNLTVRNVPPTLTLTSSAEWVTVGEPLVLSMAGPRLNAASFIVDWGDGTSSTYDGSAESFTKRYNKAGSFTPSIQGLDEDGHALYTLDADGIDVVARPSGVVTAVSPITSETASFTVTVVYKSNLKYDADSFSSTDLVTTALGSKGVTVTIKGATASDGGKTWTVQYAVKRSSNFAFADNGTYAIGLNGSKVTDLADRAIGSATAGTLAVNVRPPDAVGSSFETAKSLGEFTRTRIRVNRDYVGSSFDKTDMYRMKVADNGLLKIKLSELDDKADLQVFDGSGKVIAEARRGGASTEDLQLKLPKGWIYVRVYDTKGGGTGYALRIELSDTPKTPTNVSGTPPKVSSPLPSDGDDRAAPIQLGTFESGDLKKVTNTIGGSDRDDYYRFRLDARGLVDLSITGTSAALEILDGNGKRIASADVGGTTKEALALTLNSGWYYVHVVDRAGSSSPSEYGLRLKAA